MSRTYRKDRDGKKVRDGQHRYKCRCSWCMGIERKNNLEKLAQREIKMGVAIVLGDELQDFKQARQEYYKDNPYETLEEEINWENYKKN